MDELQLNQTIQNRLCMLQYLTSEMGIFLYFWPNLYPTIFIKLFINAIGM